MPRKGRGGARVGTPGTSYSNRTDLNAQPIRTAPGQAYGKATQQADLQRQMPLPQATLPAVPGPAPMPGRGAPPVAPENLYAPSGRSDEPVQSGLPIGPGEGPMAGPSPLERLQAVYRLHPNEDIAAAIARMSRR